METVGIDQSRTLVYIPITYDPDGIIQIRLNKWLKYDRGS